MKKIKSLKIILLLTVTCLFLVQSVVKSQAYNPANWNWPKEINTDNAVVVIYQPQINSLEGNMLDSRAAISVKRGSDEPVFGAIWFESRIFTDKTTRMVTLEEINIKEVKFPNAGRKQIGQLKDLLESEIPKWQLTMSLDQLLTGLENEKQSKIIAENMDNTPPRIFYNKQPAVLIQIDGEPNLKMDDITKIFYVVNTPYFIVLNPVDKRYYLKGGKWWYTSNSILSGWRYTLTPPRNIQAFAKEAFQEDPNYIDSVALTLNYPPDVLVSIEPAELLVTNGDPEFSPVNGTNLLYVTNSEDDILFDINSQQYYVLLSGRWYTSYGLDKNDWKYVSPDALPEDFAYIPDNSDISNVRSNVQGTIEANEAVLENQIPQTAKIDRRSATTDVYYDGDPYFMPIEGTRLYYAVNTDKAVLRANNRYYCVDDAIWFQSVSPRGPWVVCVSPPSQIDRIPPSYPIYNIRYVHIYDYTPDVVYVGYTPGYTGSYIYRNTVVYGTGYRYHSWYRNRYYPRPTTYGFGVHYNTFTGWGYTVGVTYGWINNKWYSSDNGWWGPAGYRYGYRYGYSNRNHYNYSYSYYHGNSTSYTSTYYSSYHRPVPVNVYHNRTAGVIYTSATRRSPVTNTTNVNNHTSTSARSATRRPAVSQSPNNVYTDPKGKVYRRDDNGTWQKRNQGDWKNAGTSTVQSPVRRTTTTTQNRNTQNQNNTNGSTRRTSVTNQGQNLPTQQPARNQTNDNNPVRRTSVNTPAQNVPAQNQEQNPTTARRPVNTTYPSKTQQPANNPKPAQTNTPVRQPASRASTSPRRTAESTSKVIRTLDTDYKARERSNQRTQTFQSVKTSTERSPKKPAENNTKKPADNSTKQPVNNGGRRR